MSSWEVKNVTTKEEVQISEEDRMYEVIGCEVEAGSMLGAELDRSQLLGTQLGCTFHVGIAHLKSVKFMKFYHCKTLHLT